MKNLKKYLLGIGMLLLTVSFSHAQGILGKWKTVDDETGETKSIVELYNKDGKVYGKVTKLLLPEDKGKVCEKCSGSERNKPIEGMIIVKGLSKEKDSNEYEGGSILDPKKGKEYKCKMWIDKEKPNLLNVRGYVAFFFRTQQWHRVTD